MTAIRRVVDLSTNRRGTLDLSKGSAVKAKSIRFFI